MERKERLTYEIAILMKEREAIDAAEAFVPLFCESDDDAAIEAAAVECLRSSAHLANLRMKAAQAFAANDMNDAIGMVGNVRSDEWIQGVLAGLGVKWTPPESEKTEPAPAEEAPSVEFEAQS